MSTATNSTSTILYVGILNHKHGTYSPCSGYDYDEVLKATKQAYHESSDIEIDDPVNHEPDPYTNWCVVSTSPPAPPAPKEPQWFTDLTELLPPSKLASAILESWDMECLLGYAHDHLEKAYSDPYVYLSVLSEGHYRCELETPYEEGFLEDLAEMANRNPIEYKWNDKLVILDWLRHA